MPHRFTLTLAPSPGVRKEDAMSEAARKILFHQFEIMLKHEEGARSGTDSSAIHDMRVATRRMRSALRMFAPFFKKSVVGRYGDDLKETAAALGGVRDLDVFRETLDAYATGLPEHDQDGIHAFRDFIAAPEEAARAALVEWLDSKAFREFLLRFHEFLTTPGAGTAHKTAGIEPHLVRHVVPLMVYQQFTAMRAYEPVLSVAALDTLHQLRIEAKRFRYLLEFFSEVLGPEAKTAINAVKALQDHLGALQDARVSSGMLQDHLRTVDDRTDVSALLVYLNSRESEKQRLIGTVTEAWAAFNDYEVRRAVALAVAVL